MGGVEAFVASAMAELKDTLGGVRMKLNIRILPNDHGGFTAICPTLPGCMSKGSTREEAREKLDEAICGYFAAINNFVPEHLPPEVVEVS